MTSASNDVPEGGRAPRSARVMGVDRAARERALRTFVRVIQADHLPASKVLQHTVRAAHERQVASRVACGAADDSEVVLCKKRARARALAREELQARRARRRGAPGCFVLTTMSQPPAAWTRNGLPEVSTTSALG